MRIYLHIIYITLLLVACNKQAAISTNPIEPNYGITLEQITAQGFKLETASCGFCCYQKAVDNKKILFTMNFEDHCQIIQTQEILIPIDTVQVVTQEDELAMMSGRGKVVNFQKDSLYIESIIKGIGGVKVSNTKKLGGTNTLVFDVKNKSTGCMYGARLSYGVDNVLYLSFEVLLLKENK